MSQLYTNGWGVIWWNGENKYVLQSGPPKDLKSEREKNIAKVKERVKHKDFSNASKIAISEYIEGGGYKLIRDNPIARIEIKF